MGIIKESGSARPAAVFKDSFFIFRNAVGYRHKKSTARTDSAFVLLILMQNNILLQLFHCEQGLCKETGC